MKKRVLRALALILALALLLSGCMDGDYAEEIQLFRELTGIRAPEETVSRENGSGGTATYADMEYIRPDLEALERSLENAKDLAATGDDPDEIEDAVYDYYDLYNSFYTNYNLAYICYCADLTDRFWEAEYNYCDAQTATVDAQLDSIFYALADSPLRSTLETDDYFGEDAFADYDGESIYTDEFVALLDRETELTGEYYDLNAQALGTDYYSDEYFNTYEPLMGQVLVELVEVRQALAACAGYDTYPEFAYDYYYYRDYTPEEALAYTDEIQDELADVYRRANNSNVWSLISQYASASTARRYVADFAEAMGGEVQEAFDFMDEKGLYDLSAGEKKMETSFEVYLTSYEQPFVFVCPSQSLYDCLTFAHEFGHFANDYASDGSYAGIDVAEIFSQGLEFLSLCYSDSEEVQTLTRYKMADSLSTYMEQAAYAAFEHRLYDLTGDDLTLENVRALYEQTCLDFGFDSWGWDSRDYVTIEHFFTSPMYVISYVVSNDAALQLYQMELAEPGSGLALYEDNLDTEESYFLAFVDAAGLESPFQPGRLREVRKTMEAVFG